MDWTACQASSPDISNALIAESEIPTAMLQNLVEHYFKHSLSNQEITSLYPDDQEAKWV